MGATSGTDMALFKRFRETWKKLDKDIYKTGSNKVPVDVRSTVLGFFKHHLSAQKKPRKWWWKWTIIFLGGIPKNGISFRIPGAISHARWITKAIYIFKICLFQDQFQLSDRRKNYLKRLFLLECTFEPGFYHQKELKHHIMISYSCINW